MTDAPIAEHERADVLDALRGFALLGIFISHVPDFSGYTFMTPEQRAALDAYGVDPVVAALQDFLIRNKFFSLFSLLFGIGFAVQLESAARRGADFARHFARRLTVLSLIGLAHALIWYGDILKDYALIGFTLILLRRWDAKAIALAAVVVFAFRFLWPFIVFALLSGLSEATAGGEPGGSFASLTQTFSGADPTAIFGANLELLRLKALQMIYDGKAISVLAMFVLGALIGKLRLYRDLDERRPLLRRVFWLCAPLGVIGNVALTPLHAMTPSYPPTALWVVEQSLSAVAVPLMTLGYASGFALLWPRVAALRALVPAGRMALTTYISQTLILMALFYGVGLGLHGQVRLTSGVLLALAIFAVQCALSALWLQWFRFGPIEWLWRCATYGARIDILRMRRAPQ